MNYNFTTDNRIEQFILLLKEELKNVLPGVDSHLLLAPEYRIKDMQIGEKPTNAMESSVLILLFPADGRLKTVVILRNEYDGVHSGQVSLPGGKTELSDINFEHTALRESKEEIGIDPEEIEILGQLSRFYVKPSNFIIYPFIGFMPKKPTLVPDITEVQRIIEVDIFNEINYSRKITKTLLFKNQKQIEVPGFEVDNEFIWGATAMIFSELIQVFQKVFERLEAR